MRNKKTKNKHMPMLRLSALSGIKDFFSRKRKRKAGVFAVFFSGIFLLGGLMIYLATPPGDFPTQEIIEIPDGMTLYDAASLLEERSFVRSKSLFEWISRTSRADGKIVAGEYLFTAPITAWGLADRLGMGRYGIPEVKISFPEGLTAYDMAEKLKEKIPDFDADRFVLIAAQHEGYLFPDTYYFSERASPEDVLDVLLKNFDKNFALLNQEDIEASGHSRDELIVMASIIEKEAWDPEVRRMISGILWRRIEENIPLQVDAVFQYINGKNTYELSRSDLRIDSPYNTYRYKGLPPTAIANPSLDAIDAAIHPAKSPYLYYLSDRSGETYYAKDFEGHKENKRKYLN